MNQTNGIKQRDIQIMYGSKRMYQIPNSPNNKSSLIHHQKQYSDYHIINPNQAKNEKIIHRSIKRNFDPEGNSIITTKIVREIDFDNNKNNMNSNSIMNIRPKAINSTYGRNNEHKSEILRYSNYSNNEEIDNNASVVYNKRNYGYDMFTPNTYESQEKNYTKINAYSGSGESDGSREYYSSYRSPMTGKYINLKREEVSPGGVPNYTSGSDYDEMNMHSISQIGNKYLHNPDSNLNYSQRMGVNNVKYRRYNLESPYTQNGDFDSPDRNNNYNGPYFRNIQIDKIKGIQPIYQEKMNMMNNQVETTGDYERNVHINRSNYRINNQPSIPRYYRDYSDKREDILNGAAIQLQANIRGYLVRKKVLRYITLALYYQSFCDKIQDILVFHVRGEVFDILKNKLNIKSKYTGRNRRRSPSSNSKRKNVITTRKEITEYSVNENDTNDNTGKNKSRNMNDNLGYDKYKKIKEYTQNINNDIYTPLKSLRKEYSENIIFNRINRTNRPNRTERNYCKKHNLNYNINYSNTENNKFDYRVSPTKKVTHYYLDSPCSTNKPHNRFYKEIDGKSTNIYRNNLSTYRSYKNINFRNYDRFGHYKYNKYGNNTSTMFQDKPDYSSGIGTRSYSRGMVKTTYSSSNQNIHRCHCLDDVRRQKINNENININIYRENDYNTRRDMQDMRKEVYTEKIIRKDEIHERKYNYNGFNDVESDNFISLNIVRLPHRKGSSSNKEEIYSKTVETKEYMEDKNKKIVTEEPQKRRFSKIEVNKAETVRFMPLSKSKRDIFTNTPKEPNIVDKAETINIVGKKKIPKVDKEKERREKEEVEREIERRITERVEIEKREIERIDRERKDKERRDRLDQERKDKEKRNQEEQILIERERKIQIEQERLDREWKEMKRREKENERRREEDEKNRKDWEEKERLEYERRLKDEKDRRDREKRDRELRDKLDQERRDREKKEMEQLLIIEREKIVKIEKERLEKEMKEREKKKRDDDMKREREERLRREKLEKIERERKLEEEKRERERKEKERKDLEKKEKEKRDRDEKLRIEREERIRKEEIIRIERERKMREDQERRDRERKEKERKDKEKKDKEERARKEEMIRIERETKLRLEREKRERERKEQEAKRKKEKEERDRLNKIKIQTTKTTTTIIDRDRPKALVDNYEKERKERLEKILGNLNTQTSQKTTTTTTKITTKQITTDINRNRNVGVKESKYVSTATHYKPNIQIIKTKEEGGGGKKPFDLSDYILKKDCKENLEKMKTKLIKEYTEKIEMEKRRGIEELRINQENLEKKNKREIERLIEMHKQKETESLREIERERELSKKREMELQKLKEKEKMMGLQIETDKQREMQRQREIDEKNRKKNYMRMNKEIEINLKTAESFEGKQTETKVTIKRDREQDILRAKEIIRIFILSRCDPLMKKRKYFNVWRRKAHLLELLENSKIIQEFCRSNLEMSKIKKIIKMWKNLSKKLFYKTRIKILRMKPKISKKNIRLKKLYELLRITKLTTCFSRRRFIHFIILIWHIYAKNIHKKRVNMKYLYENLLKTYMTLANDIFGNNQYENPSVQDAMYEAVNTNKFITLMPDDVPLARKHYEEMRKIKSVDSKGNKTFKSSTTKVEIEKKEFQKKYYMGKINENIKDENNSESDDADKFKNKKLSFLEKYRKNKFINNIDKKKSYSYTGRNDKTDENTDKNKDTNENKIGSNIGTNLYLNRFGKSNESKTENIVGTNLYLNRFGNKDDKNSEKSNENKIETNIGTNLYLNRFGSNNKYGNTSNYRNKSDNKDNKTFSYTTTEKKDDAKYTSKYGSNVGVNYSTNLKHTTSYNNIPKIDSSKYINNISSNISNISSIGKNNYDFKAKPLVHDTYQGTSYIKNISEEPKTYSKKIEIKTTTTTSNVPNGRLGNNNFIYNSNLGNKYGTTPTALRP